MSSLSCSASHSDRVFFLTCNLPGTCVRSATSKRGKAGRIALAFLLLMFVAASAFAQNEPKEPAGQSDIRTSIRQLVQADQPEVTMQSPAPAPGDVRTQPLIRIIPYGRRGNQIKTGIRTQAPINPHLNYWGGPVLSNIQVVVVFWGADVAPALTANGAIDQFYTDITSSRYFDELTEYSTAGVTGANGTSTSNQKIGHGTFAGKFTINPSICPGPAACNITDAQIQTELTNQINSSHLPPPQTDGQGNINTYYSIYFPPAVTISLDPTTRSCVQGGFCAYHANTSSLIPYGVFPDFSAGGCSVGCGLGTTLQIATIASSHEMAETVTDADAGVATVLGPPLAWFDGANNAEISDLCDPNDTSVTAGGNTYTVEQMFSNLQAACVSAPPAFSMAAPAGGAGPSVPFSMMLTVQNSASTRTLTNYLGTVHFTSSDPGAVLPADYTFTAADAGVHKFPFTLSVLGDQTITVTDTHSSGFTVTTTVNVNTVPDMTIALQHSGNFGFGQTGSYTITASNVGGGPSSGTVTVADALPPGLTAAAMSGTGWTCALATVTCTRADALAVGQSYPPITLTVNVSPFAFNPAINTATVSGGGETVTSDDVVTDPTTIVNPGIDLAASFTTNRLSTSLGSNGVTFTANVTNFGSVGTTGTVTFSATLAPGITATDISGTGWSCTLADLTCTRNDVLPSAQSFPPVTVTFNVSLTLQVNGPSFSVTVSGGGADTNSANNTSTISVDIFPALSIFGGSIIQNVVPAGSAAQFQFGVSGNTAAGTVTFSCIEPPPASSCSFNPPTLTNSTAQVTMTITTTRRAAVFNGPQKGNRNPWLLPIWLLMLTAMGASSLKLVAGPGRRRRFVPVLGGCTLLLAGILVGCGGGSSHATILPTSGTPAGTYTVTFTATSSNTNIAPISTKVTLQVQ